jgi:hypothetical protein
VGLYNSRCWGKFWFPLCFDVKSMLGFTVFGRLVDGVRAIISKFGPTVFSDSAVVGYVLFTSSFMCYKIMGKL